MSFLPATTDSLALALEAKDPSEAISILYRVLENPSSSSEALRIKEQAISNLSDLLRQEKRADDLRRLLTQLRPFFSLIPKAKTAKIVRGIIDAVAKIPGTSNLQISLCKEMVEWTRAEKRTFLRQRVEARLAALLMENKEYVEAVDILGDYKVQLEEDPIVHRHLSSLYDTLLEQNLCRLIEPFSRVEISHVAELIELPIDHVEKKLPQMILDKKFAGTLDQGAGCLIIFENSKPDAIFPATLETIANIDKVVDSLYMRSGRIMA